MLDVFATYATDETAELSGAWQTLNGAKFLVARAGNRNYVKKLSALVDQNKQALDAKDDAAEALSQSIMIDVLTSTVLLGWSGVGFKGADMDYSTDNAKTLLGIKDFRRQIEALSSDIDNFKAAAEVAQTGN